MSLYEDQQDKQLLNYVVQPHNGDKVENVVSQDARNIKWKQYEPKTTSAGHYGPTKFQQDCLKEQETTKDKDEEEDENQKVGRDISDMISDTPTPQKIKLTGKRSTSTPKSKTTPKSKSKPKPKTTSRWGFNIGILPDLYWEKIENVAIKLQYEN